MAFSHFHFRHCWYISLLLFFCRFIAALFSASFHCRFWFFLIIFSVFHSYFLPHFRFSWWFSSSSSFLHDDFSFSHSFFITLHIIFRHFFMLSLHFFDISLLRLFVLFSSIDFFFCCYGYLLRSLRYFRHYFFFFFFFRQLAASLPDIFISSAFISSFSSSLHFFLLFFMLTIYSCLLSLITFFA